METSKNSDWAYTPIIFKEPQHCPPKFAQPFEEVFELLSQIPSLQKLTLCENFIVLASEAHYIHPTIKNLQALRELDISSLYWNWLPETISELEYLEKIWMGKFQYERSGQNLLTLFPNGSFVEENTLSYFATGQ